MPSRFLGQKTVVMPDNSKMKTMSWLIDQFNYDVRKPIPTSAGIPLQGLTNNVDWYFAELQPIAWQGNAPFGPTYSVQFTIAKQQASVAGTSFVVPGRVFANIADTGQTFFFPTELLEPSTLASLAGNPIIWEHHIAIFPVVIQANGNLDIYLEPDILNGAVSLPTTEVRVVLFNQPMPVIALT